ncbi:transketolase family protein [Terriglobus albidus]|uniref:transketolase family protein n=1 Tax=Terriglobus albidus TaxID=1592106 RepID=UPI0021E09CB1|nr:transketolase family protein [Terriglobus albidus]
MVVAPPVETSAKTYDCREAYSRTLEEMAAQDKRVCAVINDSVSSTKLKKFKELFPERFVNVGIAEQNMVGVGAGLANGGMVPYVCGASCFLTARAMEQVKVDLGYSKWNVKLCGMSSGMAYGQLGATHHSIEDMAWTRIIPNLTVIVPADPLETEQVMRYSLRHDGPMFLRISRVPVPKVHDRGYQFTLGRAALMNDGDDVTIITNGILVARALQAAKLLEERGIFARVLNMSSIKPLDSDAILKAARETRGIVTAEEALTAGGLGGAVAEVLALHHPARMRMLGLPDVFAPTGSAEFLLDHFHLNAEGIVNAALDLLGAKK